MDTPNISDRTSNVGARIGLLLIRAYQLLLGPFAGGACRFEPSCSEYAMHAVRNHGLRRGLWLAVRRVARCHPLAQPGVDPVPPTVSTGVPDRSRWRAAGRS